MQMTVRKSGLPEMDLWLSGTSIILILLNKNKKILEYLKEIE